MLTKILLLATVAILLILTLLCAGMRALPIETAIRSGVSSNLASASLSGVHVDADGRDITLTGSVPSQEQQQQAGDLARASAGVRTVDNYVTVAESPLASQPQAKAVQKSINNILLDKKIEFEINSDRLLPQSIPVLEAVLKVVKDAPLISIRIEGYTDDAGDPKMNRLLSKSRADAVVDWLINHGIDKTRMTASGFGSDKPIATNTTSAGRFANRRVEILTN